MGDNPIMLRATVTVRHLGNEVNYSHMDKFYLSPDVLYDIHNSCVGFSDIFRDIFMTYRVHCTCVSLREWLDPPAQRTPNPRGTL